MATREQVMSIVQKLQKGGITADEQKILDKYSEQLKQYGYNPRTQGFEKVNPTQAVNEGPYSMQSKIDMLQKAGYDTSKLNAGNYDKWQDVFYRGPQNELRLNEENIKQYKKSSPYPDWFTPFDQSQYEQNFAQNAEDYKAAQKRQFGAETARGMQRFEQADYDLRTKQAQQQEDYARLTGQLQQEKNRSIAGLSREFAAKMSNAANAYGQRGILNSGAALKSSKNQMEGYQAALGGINDQYWNQKEGYDVQQQRANQYYPLMLERNAQDIQNYKTERSDTWAGKEAGINTALNQQYLSGLLGSYSSTDTLNRVNANRNRSGLPSVTPGIGGLLFNRPI